MVKMKNLMIDIKNNLKLSMEKINENGLGIVFVVSNKKIVGSLTDGDIRRHLLSGGSIEDNVSSTMNTSPVVLNDSAQDYSSLKDKAPPYGSLIVPLLNSVKEPVNFFAFTSKGERLEIDNKLEKSKLNPVKTVAIIGGAGYLGSVLCRQLLSKGYSVNILDNLTYGSKGIDNLFSNKNFSHINGSMEKVSDIIEAVKDSDAVVHLGAIVGDPASAIDPSRTLSINLHSTKLVSEICKHYNINRFIFASTCSVYGKSEGEEGLTEDSSMNPVSLYARTKIDSEKSLLSMANRYFSPTILRFSTLFGMSERMRFDLVVNILCAKAYFDNKITIFGGQQYRPMLSTSDASLSIIKCLESPIEKVSGEVFNVGNTSLNFKIIDIGRLVHERAPNAEIIITENDEDTRDYNVNFSKIKDIINFQTKDTLESGIDEIFKAFEKGKFKNYNDNIYNNYKSITEEYSK